MLRFFLYKFLNTFNKPYENITPQKLNEFISNKNLIDEIILMKKFQFYWRNKLGTKIIKDKYSLKELKIIKSAKYIMLITKLSHSFLFVNPTIKKTCKEDVYYLFIIKNMTIICMCNKEESPMEYDNLIQTFSSRIDNLLLAKKNIETNQWYNNINKIDSLFQEFTTYTSNISRIGYTKPKYLLNKDKIVKYARRYALTYNKSYKDFDKNGGDCTNFVSQCLHAGGLSFSLSWKPYTNTWIRVNELYYYILSKGFNKTDSTSYMKPGAIIQFHSIKKGFFSHSGIITEVLQNNDCLYCCHSYNKLDYPLSEVYPLFYNKIRIINLD